MTFPGYPSYKRCEDKWINAIPDHWETRPIKSIAEVDNSGFYGEEADELACNFPVATTAQIDKNGSFSIEDMPTRSFDDEKSSRYLCKEGDILVVKSSGSATNIISGKAGIVKAEDKRFIFSNFLMRIKSDRKKVMPDFLYYFIRSDITKQRVSLMCSSTTYPNLKVGEYISAHITLPPVSEQAIIVKFLDHETAKIDALIAEQEQLIELLQEKRQAVISHAVTKGIYPNAPMKESGVEWLGAVPRHWEVSRLGWIAEQVNDINHEMPEAVQSGVPFLSAKDLSDDGRLRFENDVKQISEEDFERLSQKIKPEKGDIIYSRIGTIGRAALVETDKRFLVSYSCCVIRIRSRNIHLKFLRFLLASDLILTESKARTRSMGQPDLGLGEIRKFPMPIPPIEEQRAIDQYLTKEINELDSVCNKTFVCLNVLQERRLALISAAVTGQIDVRGLVAEEEVGT